MNKSCMFCRYVNFDMGSPGYSELTPGDDASIYCRKSHWDMSNYGEIEEFRGHIKKAETCPDYEFCMDESQS